MDAHQDLSFDRLGPRDIGDPEWAVVGFDEGGLHRCIFAHGKSPFRSNGMWCETNLNEINNRV